MAVRVRPAIRDDELLGDAPALHCAQSTVWILPKADKKQQEQSTSSETRQFVFDWVLPPETSQEDVFARTCVDTGVIDGVGAGINGCVLCYGQTGAGKTHTLGNLDVDAKGIIPRALERLFDGLRSDTEAGAVAEAVVSMAYVQIYMEAVHDLLDPSASVAIREVAGEGASLAGNKWVTVQSTQAALDLMEKGSRHRVTASTSMNDTSSRSHSVLIVNVRCQRGPRQLHGKLYLVDLAGSERVKRSEVEGVAFEEAVSINTSLTCLGRCITALAAQGKGPKPPFRETKLTRLLSSAFGGKAVTVLVVCVAPSQTDSFETVNSLQFGQQAMSVKVKATANAVVDYRALCVQLASQLDAVVAPQRRVDAQVCAELHREIEEALALAEEAEELRLEKEELECATREAERRREAALAEHGVLSEARDKSRRSMASELQAVLHEIDQTEKLIAAEKAGQSTAHVVPAAQSALGNAGDEEASQMETYATAARTAWEDVRRYETEKKDVEERFEKARLETEHALHEKEDMLV